MRKPQIKINSLKEQKIWISNLFLIRQTLKGNALNCVFPSWNNADSPFDRDLWCMMPITLNYGWSRGRRIDWGRRRKIWILIWHLVTSKILKLYQTKCCKSFFSLQILTFFYELNQTRNSIFFKIVSTFFETKRHNIYKLSFLRTQFFTEIFLTYKSIIID